MPRSDAQPVVVDPDTLNPSPTSTPTVRAGATPVTQDPIAVGAGVSQPQPKSWWGTEPTSNTSGQIISGQAGQDYGRIAANSFGVGDRAVAGWSTVMPAMFPKLFGPGATDQDALQKQYDAALQTERGKTAEASARAGTIPTALATAAGYAPAMLIPGMGEGGVMANIGQQALLASVAAAGRGENVPQAALGGAVGGAAGGVASKYAIGPAVNWAANKIGQATGLLADPAAITAKKVADAEAAWAPTRSMQVNPGAVDAAHTSAINSLDDNQTAQISDGFNSLIQKQRNLNLNGQPTTASQVAGYADNLKNQASSGAEKILASRIGDNLDNVLGAHGMADAVQNARFASKQANAAGNLQDFSEGVSDWNANPADAARGVAQKYYTRGQPDYQDLVNISKAGQGGGMSSYPIERAFAPLVEAGGLYAGGPALGMASEIGFQLGRPGIGAALHAAQRNALQNKIGAAYPNLVGVPGTRANLPTGELLKSLMLGGTQGYQNLGPASSYIPPAISGQ
jgi:hypothetical protein